MIREPPFTLTPNGELVAQTRQPMKIRIILEGRGGELDRQTIEPNRPSEISDDIHRAMRAWVLAPGDIIRIECDEQEAVPP